MDDSLTREEALGIEKELEQIPNVSDATFVSRETAMKEFQEKYADDPLFADLEEDTLRHRYVIRTIDIEQTRATKEAVEKAISRCIEQAYRRSNRHLWQELFTAMENRNARSTSVYQARGL